MLLCVDQRPIVAKLRSCTGAQTFAACGKFADVAPIEKALDVGQVAGDRGNACQHIRRYHSAIGQRATNKAHIGCANQRSIEAQCGRRMLIERAWLLFALGIVAGWFGQRPALVVALVFGQRELVQCFQRRNPAVAKDRLRRCAGQSSREQCQQTEDMPRRVVGQIEIRNIERGVERGVAVDWLVGVAQHIGHARRQTAAQLGQRDLCVAHVGRRQPNCKRVAGQQPHHPGQVVGAEAAPFVDCRVVAAKGADVLAVFEQRKRQRRVGHAAGQVAA